MTFGVVSCAVTHTIVKGISHGKKIRCKFNAGLVYRDNHALLRPYCSIVVVLLVQIILRQYIPFSKLMQALDSILHYSTARFEYLSGKNKPAEILPQNFPVTFFLT